VALAADRLEQEPAPSAPGRSRASQSTIATRPPGFTTRASSANTRGLSGMCESDSIAIAASNAPSGSPLSSQSRTRIATPGARGAPRPAPGDSVSPVTDAPRSRASSRAVAP
jgi:hypothetical protein